MTALVIILIVIGIALIVLSLFLVDEDKFNPEEYVKLLADRELSFSETGKIRDKVDEIISEMEENHLTKTENELSKISNEKIIAVSDFSDQILEKISRNHEEVVFLYNMLNEKQEELKNLMVDADKISKSLEQVVKVIKNVEAKKAEEKHQVSTNKETQAKSAIDALQINKQVDNTAKKNIEVLTEIKPEDYKNKILELYSQGFSIIDISKTLEIGQGEVKLVVDLFNNRPE